MKLDQLTVTRHTQVAMHGANNKMQLCSVHIDSTFKITLVPKAGHLWQGHR